jgi:hypothetical protein
VRDASWENADEKQHDAGRAAAAGERRNHSNFEAENRHRSRNGQDERPGIDGGEFGRIEAKRKRVHRDGVPEHRVNRKLDREVEDDAHDRRGYG